MEGTIKGMKRTCGCGELTADSVGGAVTLMGWVQKRRDLGGLIFIWLRDRSGMIQAVFNNEADAELFKAAQTLRGEFVVAVTGKVARRSPENVNHKISNGDIEVLADSLRILSEADTPPIYIEEDSDANEAVRLKYRYLDLRRPDMQKNLILRHRVTKLARDYFDRNGFLEIETPMLTKSTPEGARDYLVPSRVQPWKFYALPQSPQLFKQLLMVAGYDRYMQIARCFRDEDLRADRQPEFTQIDLEMSFVDVDDVISVNEGFIVKAFKEILGVELKAPFIRLTYRQAMDRFGSDKPDMRFGLELADISAEAADSTFKVFGDTLQNGGSIRALNAKGCGPSLSRRDIDGLVEFAKGFGVKGLSWISADSGGVKSSIAKFFTPEAMDKLLRKVDAVSGDIVFIAADKADTACGALGQLRLELARRLGLAEKGAETGDGSGECGNSAGGYRFLWVTEFPLLEFNQEENRWNAMHHPFTSPMEEDMELLDSDPGKTRAKAYDLVLNGTELGGGSIRIHRRELQQKMFALLGFTEEQALAKFGFLLEAFKYGTPPHGGMAYGLDRLAMLMAGRSSIRDVIAFPKVQNGSCPMSGAPDSVEPRQLKELGLIE